MYKRIILIVDDEDINRKLLGKILEDDYDILYAENGRQALEQLHSKSDRISAVLLDIVMPEIDGYQVLKEMSADPVLSLIPVIVSSFRDGDESEIRSLSLGAQDFIAKPYKPDIIRHRLSNLIRLRESSSIINKTQRDSLTGLYNKEYFITKAESEIKDNPEKKYDVMYLGVERFKLVNDAFGTQMGNEVIKYLSNILVEAIGKDSICGRFGADNFYMLREHKEYNNEMFLPWVDKVNQCPIDLDIRIHCGIYEVIDSSLEIEGMCDRAKMAAYTVKGNYNTFYAVYDDSLRGKMVNEQFILSTMKKALEEEQFTVYYQPKYDLSTESIAGAEALVRWIHPERGFMSPGDFIPIFERNGFITQLDRYVWEKTCKDIRHWMDQGLPPVAVSVNVSRADIYNPKLMDILLNLVAKYQIPIRYLHLEITESAYTKNPEQIITTVSKLREAGFIIEMDDFGTGYSSLNMLAEMPVDVMKLDMRFVQMEAKLTSGRGILGFIISLAKWLGLAVVAEGVETLEQITMLRSMDCNYVQGYYYAKPMNKSDFIELLKKSKVSEMVCNNKIDEQTKTLRQSTKGLKEGRVMLIVDDIEVNRVSLASVFADEYIIVEKENGNTALEYLQNNFADVEIIMLDLLMPEMDGFQLMEKIKSDNRMKHIPIIVTSQAGAEGERKALELQANDYITKPYNPKVIRHRVNNVLDSCELRRLKESKGKY